MSSEYSSQRGKETLSRQRKVSTVSERGTGYRDKKGELYILNGIAMNRIGGKESYTPALAAQFSERTS